jgi:hypothetical protein
MPALGTILNTDNVGAGVGSSCKLTLQANQLQADDPSLAGTNRFLTFGATTEVWKDVAGMHSTTTNTQRLFCATAGAARWNVKGSIVFAPSAVGVRVVYVDFVRPTPVLTITPINVLVPSAGSGYNTLVDFDYDESTTGGDEYWQIRIAQNSGASLNVIAIQNGTNCSWFQIRRVG